MVAAFMPPDPSEKPFVCVVGGHLGNLKLSKINRFKNNNKCNTRLSGGYYEPVLGQPFVFAISPTGRDLFLLSSSYKGSLV